MATVTIVDEEGEAISDPSITIYRISLSLTDAGWRVQDFVAS
ncbi:MAG: hypothetical protein Q4G34_01145 [Micrococcus sp.]|nr:hypothetical protein [Micrococcus sp.]